MQLLSEVWPSELPPGPASLCRNALMMNDVKGSVDASAKVCRPGTSRM